MATFKAMALKYNVKKGNATTTNIKRDGTYNCVIRVTHNRKSKYVKTAIYVSEKQLSKSGDIKDPTVADSLYSIVKGYRDRVAKIADRIDLYDIDALIEYISRGTEDIDFIEYSRNFLAGIKKEGNISTFRIVINSLVEYKSPRIPISSISANFLRSYEKYLMGDRVLVRKDRWGHEMIMKEPPLSSRTVFNYMNAIKTLFNAARDEYNNEDTGDIRIPFYPFRSYKIPKPSVAEKRNLSASQISEIEKGEGLARDVFMISFYACGMNVVDIYSAHTVRNGRLEYNRTKTKDKRSDNAFISIKIEPELEVLIDKYTDPSGARVFNFYKKYATANGLTTAVNRELSKTIPGVTAYYARHSWATIARNNCGISKDTISEALNHSSGLSITDTYLARNWDGFDNANRAVIDFIATS